MAVPLVPFVPEPAIHVDVDELGARGVRHRAQDSKLSPMLPPPRYAGLYRTDLRARAAYAEGAGIYRILPAAVCVPADRQDVASLVGWAAAHRIPLVPRGAGSAMGGGNVGDGVVVDLTGLARRLEVDAGRAPRPHQRQHHPGRAERRRRPARASGCRRIPRAGDGPRRAAWCPPTPRARARCATAASAVGCARSSW